MKGKLIISTLAAAFLWFVMFSPWTAGKINFWYAMTFSAITLIILALSFGKDGLKGLRFTWKQILFGIVIAAVLWGVFWVGDKVSQMMFDFARPGIDNIYGMKGSTNSVFIALALLFIIGPAEELFWRGFVQHSLMQKMGKYWGSAIAILIYTGIHVWSFNPMLLLAALACGVIWGGLYLYNPRWLPALIISHAIWDACAFVIFPF